jgi:hypothetical protein
MTVKELREALDKLGRGYDSRDIIVWLPGSKIDLQPSIFVRANEHKGDVMIEGNVRPGSALDI